MTSQEAAGQNRRHAKFFDGLVDMIPAQFYHPPEHEVVNTKYLKKNAKAAHKQAMKAQRKQNKRDKLDPNKAKTALGIQKERAAAAAAQQPAKAEEQQAAAGDEPQEPAEEQGPAKTLMLPQQAPASKAELSQRLEKRLQVLRAERHAQEQGSKPVRAKKEGKAAVKAKAAKQKAGVKAKQGAVEQSKAATTAAAAKAWLGEQLAPVSVPAKRKADGEPSTPEGEEPAPKKAKRLSKQQRSEEPGDGDLAFGKVEVGGHRFSTEVRRKKKLSKEQLLAEAERKQQERQALQHSAEGQVKLRQEGWRSALDRARGEKVLDDPKRIKIALKKEQKCQEKKGKEWKQRQKQQKTEQASKQQKRKDNLQTRVDAKIAKKHEKRDKKLMRAGFEGRRETPINT